MWPLAIFLIFAHFRTIEAANYIDAIFKESLRSNRVQACDGERITLSCPRNTQILVQTGFYGRVVPESQLCPGRAAELVGQAPTAYHSSTCDVIQAHTKISELCDKRRKCTVVVDSHTFDDDPCPSTSKYLQMSYACMPVSFDDESFCAGSEMRLVCREGRRLAVYSSVAENSPKRHPAQCPPRNNSDPECVDDVLPQVLRECHAREACSLRVSSEFLGSQSCHNGHLHIVYMCVNEEIFSEEAIKGELASLEQYLKESSKQPKHEPQPIVETRRFLQQKSAKIERAPETSSATHMFSNDASYVTHDEYSMHDGDEAQEENQLQANAVGIGHDVFQVFRFFKMNKEKVAACVVVSVSLAIIVVLSACIVHHLCSSDDGKANSTSQYSMERNRLVTSNVHVSSPGLLMADIEDESFLRYSLPSSTKYSHSPYDF
ncbi:unnamed protein product [Caenorhabditis auriculariae]|uniref:SUEL-type lectin domain-containing protein n=1 Tax=Caenorhabditis auriculariae TaxID=2777116 RepID=A0A8S1GSN2_9PELO|nr:unnamed protein product [Caenorhabditis auriculariae]